MGTMLDVILNEICIVTTIKGAINEMNRPEPEVKDEEVVEEEEHVAFVCHCS